MYSMTLDAGPELAGRLAESTRAAARAEWAQWNEILAAADELNARVDRTDEHFHRMVERSAIPLTIGRMTGLSEGQVVSRPEGDTSGDNLWPLCRKHHNMKGHGVLRWMLPDGTVVPVEKPDLALAS